MKNADVTLAVYLAETGLELDDVYSSNRCWSELKEAAGLSDHVPDKIEVVIRRAIGRPLHVDDDIRLEQWSTWLAEPENIELKALTLSDSRLLRMLVGSVVDQACNKDTSLAEGWHLITQ
ncbi:MAG: hypothetical protein AB8B64_01705 [Granulosicoccus sp.]